MKVRIVIPARLQSSRLPKKLIKKIGDKTLIEHVCLRAKKIKCNSIIVATDSKVIKKIVEKYNIDCWFSNKKFVNGTDRISALSKALKFQKNDIVINIQGDEFNFSLKGVTKMIETMKRKRLIKVSTLIFRNNEKEILNDTNMVKTVIDSNNEALVFTRLPIPYNSSQSSFIHIGIYGYRVDVLQKYPNLIVSPFEISEKLEQLRFLWNNVKIKCLLLKNNTSLSINTQKDLRLARKIKS
tara:strand:+ start:609 stop:1328 length:720 start_codon:yes stop_codon:yes gene_type:complete